MSEEGTPVCNVQHEGTQIKVGPNLCDVCDSCYSADVYCKNCQEYLCTECKTFHRRQKRTKDHDIMDIASAGSMKHQQLNRCLDHQDGFITKFCRTCYDVACEICVNKSHNTHDVINVEQCTEAIFKLCLDRGKDLQDPFIKMQSYKNNITRNEQSCVDKCDAIESEIARRKSKLITAITQLAEDAISEIRLTKTNVKTSFKQTADELERVLNEYETVSTPLVMTTDVHRIINRMMFIKEKLSDANCIQRRVDLLLKDSAIELGADNTDNIIENTKNTFMLHKERSLYIHNSMADSEPSNSGNTVEGPPPYVNIDFDEMQNQGKQAGTSYGNVQFGHEKWFLGKIPREECDNVLLSKGDQGSFVIRESCNRINGVNVEHVIREEAVALINASKEKVVFLVAKFSYRQKISQSVNTLHADVQQSSTRQVLLRRGLSGFGLNLAGLNDGEGVFISYIHQGSPAESGGLLRKGDQLISVNGIDVQNATLEQAASVITTAGDIADISVIHRPSEYSRWETKVAEVRMSKNCRPNQKFIAQV